MHNLGSIAKDLEGYRTIIDGNIVSLTYGGGESLCNFLNDPSPMKLAAVNSALTRKVMASFDDSSYFLSEVSPVVIDEVGIEMSSLARNFYRIRNNYDKRLRSSAGEWHGLNGVHEQGLENLKSIANRAGFFSEHLNLYREKIDWNRGENASLLGFARLHSEAMIKKTARKHKGSSLGLFLETDQKLAAYLITSAMRCNSALVTKDKGVVELVEEMRSFFGKDNLFPSDAYPLHDIVIHNPESGKKRAFQGNI